MLFLCTIHCSTWNHIEYPVSFRNASDCGSKTCCWKCWQKNKTLSPPVSFDEPETQQLEIHSVSTTVWFEPQWRTGRRWFGRWSQSGLFNGLQMEFCSEEKWEFSAERFQLSTVSAFSLSVVWVRECGRNQAPEDAMCLYRSIACILWLWWQMIHGAFRMRWETWTTLKGVCEWGFSPSHQKHQIKTPCWWTPSKPSKLWDKLFLWEPQSCKKKWGGEAK